MTGQVLPHQSPDEAGDQMDRYVAVLWEGPVTAADIRTAAAAGVGRTFGRPLRHDEL